MTELPSTEPMVFQVLTGESGAFTRDGISFPAMSEITSPVGFGLGLAAGKDAVLISIIKIKMREIETSLLIVTSHGL
jgi:hypothetical protein